MSKKSRMATLACLRLNRRRFAIALCGAALAGHIVSARAYSAADFL